MRRRELILAGLGLFLVAGCAAGQVVEWEGDGIQREGIVYAPDAATVQPTPLVLAFHGFGDVARNFQRTDIHEAWPEAIVIYFQGLTTRRGMPGWQSSASAENRDLRMVDVAVAALKAGKHVLCEKPMAVTLAECRAMIRAAKQARRKLHIAYNTRHHPKKQAVQKEWAAGRFGKPVHGRALLYYPYPEDIGHRGRGKLGGWHSFDKQVGGWAYGDCGTHLIDQLRWFLGDAKKVLASHNSNPSWGYQTPDHAVAMIAFKNGAVGTISASTGLISHNPRLEFYGDKGYIVIDGGLLGEPGSLTTGIEDVGKTNRGHGVTRRVKKRTIQLPVTKTYKYQGEAFGRTITSRDV